MTIHIPIEEWVYVHADSIFEHMLLYADIINEIVYGRYIHSNRGSSRRDLLSNRLISPNLIGGILSTKCVLEIDELNKDEQDYLISLGETIIIAKDIGYQFKSNCTCSGYELLHWGCRC